MIPKIIHYCWFGGKPLGEFENFCIRTWQELMPEYELILWNEYNFDVNSTLWTKQAYECKKYAFVSDYVRLYALKKFGGVYMDTDVEVLKSYNQFLYHPAFVGFEEGRYISTALIASEKDSIWINKMISYYDNRPFLLDNGLPESITNVSIITNMMLEYGLKPDNQFQNCQDILCVYPTDFFSPKSQSTLKVYKTVNTHCIHHFNGSWFSPYVKFKKRVRALLPYSVYKILKKLTNKL